MAEDFIRSVEYWAMALSDIIITYIYIYIFAL